jgi:hypothetical protein
MLTSDVKERIFNTLEVIRDSGKINMFEAPKYLVEMFEINRTEAKEVFLDWTKNRG